MFIYDNTTLPNLVGLSLSWNEEKSFFKWIMLEICFLVYYQKFKI